MTRLGITFKDVETTAEEILATGENPTIERIRRALGTGSNSTIAKYLQDWRAIRLLASKNDSATQNTAPDAVNAAVAQVWEKIRNESATEIKSIRENAQAEIDMAQKERIDTINLSELKQQELETLNKRFNQMSADKEIALLDLKAVHREHILLQEKYKNLENDYHVFEKNTHDKMTILMTNHQNDIDNKNKEIANIKEIYDKTLNKLSDAYENTRHEYMLAIEHFKSENRNDKKSIEQLESTIQNLQAELAESQSNFKLAASDRDSITATCKMKDEIIKNYSEVKESTQLILAEIEKLQHANKNDLESCVSQIQHSTSNLESMSKSILHHLVNQKELTISEE
ncbi:MAG: DNA-binding protein [Gammaproteobacteria bacterium]